VAKKLAMRKDAGNPSRGSTLSKKKSWGGDNDEVVNREGFANSVGGGATQKVGLRK